MHCDHAYLQGDFMLHFIDVARPDLRKKASDISMSKLHSLLGLALRTSVRSNDPHADSVDCQMSLSGEMAVDCQLLSYCDEKTEDEYVRQSIGTRCACSLFPNLCAHKQAVH